MPGKLAVMPFLSLSMTTTVAGVFSPGFVLNNLRNPGG